jgi:hypothetical protein
MLISAYLLAEPPAGKNYLGINIGAPADFDGCLHFADAMKTARDWGTLESDGVKPLPLQAVDANGWPTVDAAIVVWHGLERDNTGTYQLSFESNSPGVSIEIVWGTGTVDRIMRDPKNKRTTAEIVLTDKTESALMLRFTQTAGGVRNVSLLRPIAPGSRQSHAASERYSRSFLAALAPFHAVRFMDYLATNSNKQKYWNNPSNPILTRTQPTARSYQTSETEAIQKAGYGWQGRGGAWEDVILLCNQTGKDAWINVPFDADDDYVRNLASLLHRGNAYTNHVGLKPTLKLYVEYANELWNTSGAFDGNRNHETTLKEKGKRDPYGYNQAMIEPDNEWYWAFRRVGRKLVDISIVFRQEFGDARMMTQVRPVLAWQLGNPVTGIEPLHYLENVYLPKIAPKKSIPDFIYGGGGSAYFGPDNESSKLTYSNIWQNESMNIHNWVKSGLTADAHVCAAFGLKRLAYEGGPGLDHTGHSEEIKAAAAIDPRMETAIIEHHNAWSEWGGDLLVYFTLVHNYQWGFARPIESLSLPRYRAMLALTDKPRAAIKNFRTIPSTTAGNQFDLSNNWKKAGSSPESTDVLASEWRSYTYQVTTPGNYNVTVNYQDGSGQIMVFSDGEPIVMKKLAGAGGIGGTLVNWNKGVHSIRIKMVSGSATITTLVIQKAKT